MKNPKKPKLLIAEDDAEQMDLLASFALDEIEKLAAHENTTEKKKQILSNINIIKVGNVRSLKKVISSQEDIILAVL